MLPRTHRLSLRLFRHSTEASGLSFSSPLFDLKVNPNPASPLRFAFLISKKISTHATKRNHLKRQLSAIITASLPSLSSGFDIIIYAKRPLLITPYPQISSQLLTLLAKAGVLASPTSTV